MKIKCPQCDTAYEVSDEIASSGAQVQCAKCSNIFTATPEPDAEINLEPISEPETPSDLLNEDEKDFFSSFGAKLEKEEAAASQELSNQGEADQLFVSIDDEPQSTGAPVVDPANDIVWAESDDEEEAPTEKPAEADEAEDFDFEATPSDPDIDLFNDGDLQTEPEQVKKQEPEAKVDKQPEAEAEPKTEIEVVAAPIEPVLASKDEPAPTVSKFPPTRILIGWGALAASVLFLFVGATLLRVPITKTLPGMASLYEKVGFPVNIRGLEFYGLSHQWMKTDGRMRLVVRGEIVNITDDAAPVPEIVFAMLDGTGLEFFQWTERATTKQLLPGKRTRFQARIPAPADRVRQLKIRFAKR